MNIEKVVIENYKCFSGKFSVEFTGGLNILVGDNETGKSTILEAINLALSGILNGRYLRNELSQYLFSHSVVCKYLEEVKRGKNPEPPYIQIELFFSGVNLPLFEGNLNSEKVKKCGLVFKIHFDEEYKSEYEKLIQDAENISTIPIEYYKVSWKSCARESITSKSIPFNSVLIDSSSPKYQNGSDIYISRIIRNDLEDKEKVELSQAYRKMKQAFMADEAVKQINKKIDTRAKITNKTLNISVDLSTQNSWETTLMTYLEEIPFHQIGKGEQCVIKTKLALSEKKSQNANVILLEEPENHLSHAKLNELIKSIGDGCSGKQVIISTHSSYVANKLGLENLILIHDHYTSRLTDLPPDTFDFFKKLPGYQTLRLLLCRKAVLVEGDSDELIFQRGYMDRHEGRLPIQDGIDVMSVKLTFKRFLEIAEKIKQPTAVITDNDGKYDTKIVVKYEDYKNSESVKVFADGRNDLNTLEPQFVDANRNDLNALRSLLERDKSENEEDIIDYMGKNKTAWALKVFESDNKFNYPQYILDAIKWCDE